MKTIPPSLDHGKRHTIMTANIQLSDSSEKKNTLTASIFATSVHQKLVPWSVTTNCGVIERNDKECMAIVYVN